MQRESISAVFTGSSRKNTTGNSFDVSAELAPLYVDDRDIGMVRSRNLETTRCRSRSNRLSTLEGGG